MSFDDRNQGLFLGDQGLWAPGTYEELETALSKATEDQLKIYWEHRSYYDKFVREGGRSQIWKEMSRRYYQFSGDPIHLKFPRAVEFEGGRLKSQIRLLLMKNTGWPDFLVEWHMRNIKITLTDTKSIGDILSNVNMPWIPRGNCTCNEVITRLRKSNCGWAPPAVDGHIFFTGREYKGPCKDVLNMCRINIPKASSWDITRAFESALKTLPCSISTRDIDNTLHMVKIHKESRIAGKASVRGRSLGA